MSFIVAIDGPAGAGKSSTAQALATRLGILYLDTGALYRALALRVLQSGIQPDDRAAVERCVLETEIDLTGSVEQTRVVLDGTDVSEEIRTPAVSELASRLAAQPAVRRRLLEIQRALGRRGPLVAEGRDLGTVVFPHAEVKIFLDAGLDTRARRRHLEMLGRGVAVSLEDVREELERRDERDRTRPESPLRPAADAVVIDTSEMDPERQLTEILRRVQAHPRFPDKG